VTLDALLIGSFDAAASAARQPNSIGDPTDWPSWFSAVGTVGAFAVALYLLWVQINDRRKEARERVTAQARLLAAWVADIAEREHEDPSAFYAVTVRASNGSTAPVYDVAVTTDLGVRGSHERNPDVLGPHETRDFVITAPREPRGQPLAMVVRDAFLTEDGSRIELEDGSGVLLLENYVPAVSISFVDSAGRRWIRQPKGELQPLGI
jgi:hypothetical protein